MATTRRHVTVRNSNPTPPAADPETGRITGGKVIPLRIRSITGVAISIEIAAIGGKWFAGLNCERLGKPEHPEDRIPLSTRNAPFPTEEAAIENALRDAAGWSARRSGIGGALHAKVVEDIAKHGRQLLGRPITPRDSVPTTQAEASAKERAAAAAPAETVDIPLKDIDENPHNARLRFEGLEQLAASLQAEGQLQECIGRRKGKRVELIAGGRRFRAAKLAKLPSLRVRIVEVDDAAALVMMGRENEDREDFDPVSRGSWYQSILQARGCSQRDLAELLGVSQAAIANHVRLLELPEPWRGRLITREITETHARALLPYAGHPGAMKAIEKDWAKKELQEQPASEWPWAIADAIREEGRPTDRGRWYSYRRGGRYHSGDVKFTPAQVEQHAGELDLVTIPKGRAGKPERIAMDAAAWEKLHEPLEEAAAKKRNQPAQAKPAKAGEKRTAAQERAIQKQQDQHLAARIESHVHRWLQTRIAEALPSAGPELLERLLLWFSVLAHTRPRQEALVDLAPGRPRRRKGGLGFRELDWWALTAAKVDLRKLIGAWILAEDLNSYQCPFAREDVRAIAGELKIDAAREWRVDAEFLGLFNGRQLEALARSWKVKLPAGKVAGRVEAILAANKRKRLAAPKILLAALAGEKRKGRR